LFGQFVDWIDIIGGLQYARSMVGAEAGAAAPVGAELHLARWPSWLAIIFVILIGVITHIAAVIIGNVQHRWQFKSYPRKKIVPSHHCLNTAKNRSLSVEGKVRRLVDGGTIFQVPFSPIRQY
jgi:hypothetical protein